MKNRALRPELLAPAKNLDVALAAINHGADAVYMGANRFSAREAAGNSLHDIEKAVQYAHRYGAKIFVALNTILHEHELEEARKIAVSAHEMGVDALIIQDMAFLEMDLPPIVLHASTQTHNATPQKIKFLQDVGFARVVLARELSLEQIQEVSAATNVELEYFIHGALCVSYSGQCYLSRHLTNRSANRGACAQPCRSDYNLLDNNGLIIAKNQHLLSLKDLNLTSYLKNLADAGVCSFKIEGRLKDLNYVKNVVAHYRKAMDEIFAGEKPRSSGHVFFNFTPKPDKTFSRGFCTYFIENKQPKMLASLNSPKSLGEKVGKIKLIDKQFITVFTESKDTSFHAGDGVCFFDKNGTLHGTNINRVEGNKLWLNSMSDVSQGATLFRNFDYVFQKQLAADDSAKRIINVDVTFEESATGVLLTASDEDGISTSLSIEKEQVEARNVEKSLLTIHEQLSKSGSSMFKINNVNINNCISGFYAIAELNSWRRAVLEQLAEKREKSYIVETKEIVNNNITYPYLNLNYKLNILNSFAQKFYMRHGAQNIAPAYEAQKPQGKSELMVARYCILRELNLCKKENKQKLNEPLFLENNKRKLELSFDCSKCEMKVLD